MRTGTMQRFVEFADLRVDMWTALRRAVGTFLGGRRSARRSRGHSLLLRDGRTCWLRLTVAETYAINRSISDRPRPLRLSQQMAEQQRAAVGQKERTPSARLFCAAGLTPHLTSLHCIALRSERADEVASARLGPAAIRQRPRGAQRTAQQHNGALQGA